MSVGHAFEAALVEGIAGVTRRVPWRTTLSIGGGLGALVDRLGIRARVARNNLAIAFPERSEAEREAILHAHYRELGRIASEYPSLPELVRAAEGEVVAELGGREHLERIQREGRGALLLTGHFGNFELLGGWLARMHPLDFVVKPLSNPRVDRWLSDLRRRAGVGQIPLGAGVRAIYRSLRQNRWVALVGDQDARSAGVFVPFFGRPASTPRGPADLALRTGAPLIMGFASRMPDGRHRLEMEPPFAVPERHDEAAVEELTARHTARLEAWIRKRPDHWLWLHRRWKTVPSSEGARAAGPLATAPGGH